MNNEILMLLLCILALCQPTKQRFLIAITFSLSCVVHLIVSESFPDVLYYLSAGAFDLVMIFIMCLFSKPTRFTDWMILICITSLFLNLYGLVIYGNHYSSASYEAAFLVLYAVSIGVFVKKDKGNGDKSFDWFWLPYLKRNCFCNSLHKKA